MPRNTGRKQRAVVLADQLAVPIGVAVVEDRHHVHVEARALERDRDAVGVGLDLIRVEVRERLAQPLGQVVEQLRHIVRRVGAADVAGDIDIVEGAQRRAFR